MDTVTSFPMVMSITSVSFLFLLASTKLSKTGESRELSPDLRGNTFQLFPPQSGTGCWFISYIPRFNVCSLPEAVCSDLL